MPDPMSPDKHEPRAFYVVLREDDGRQRRHYTADEAHAEAERLALKEGKGFYVCRAEAKVRLTNPPTQWVRTFEGVIDAADECPQSA